MNTQYINELMQSILTVIVNSFTQFYPQLDSAQVHKLKNSNAKVTPTHK